MLLTEDDRPVAEVRPAARGPSVVEERRLSGAAWRAKHEELLAMLRSKPDYGVRLGEITEEDKYDPSQW